VWTMLETHIIMSSLISRLTFLLTLRLIFLMDLTIAYMVLVHEIVVLCLNALVSTHVLIVVLIPRIGTVSPARGAYSHFDPSCFDGPRFSRRGSRPTCSNCEVHKIVVTSSCRMVKCWIPKIFLTNPNLLSFFVDERWRIGEYVVDELRLLWTHDWRC
jgi:hypothetical protein